MMFMGDLDKALATDLQAEQVRMEKLRLLFEAIEAYMDSWHHPETVPSDVDPDDVLYRAMAEVVPTDASGRYPWDEGYGGPDI